MAREAYRRLSSQMVRYWLSHLLGSLLLSSHSRILKLKRAASIVVSTVAQNCRQFSTIAFSPPWFSPACQRSFRLPTRYLPRSRPQGEPGWNVTPWASASPTTFTCLLVCRRAWPASLCRGAPLAGFSPPTCSRRGRVRHLSRLLRPAEAPFSQDAMPPPAITNHPPSLSPFSPLWPPLANPATKTPF